MPWLQLEEADLELDVSTSKQSGNVLSDSATIVVVSITLACSHQHTHTIVSTHTYTHRYHTCIQLHTPPYLLMYTSSFCSGWERIVARAFLSPSNWISWERN